MRKPQLRAVVSGLAAVGSALTLMLVTAAPGQAATSGTIPAGASSCSSGQPKLDYEYWEVGEGWIWSNVCGNGDWAWQSGTLLVEVRMPTTPYHRIWLHQYGGSGTVCLYSQNTDISIPAVTWEDAPGDVQVSANTAPC
jgi:hypothetical protein